MEKMGVGVKNSRGKNPKYGKNLVVGAKSGGFGKMSIPSWNFFPTPPPVLEIFIPKGQIWSKKCKNGV